MKQVILSRQPDRSWKKVHVSMWLWTGKLYMLWLKLCKKLRRQARNSMTIDEAFKHFTGVDKVKRG